MGNLTINPASRLFSLFEAYIFAPQSAAELIGRLGLSEEEENQAARAINLALDSQRQALAMAMGATLAGPACAVTPHVLREFTGYANLNLSRTALIPMEGVSQKALFMQVVLGVLGRLPQGGTGDDCLPVWIQPEIRADVRDNWNSQTAMPELVALLDDRSVEVDNSRCPFLTIACANCGVDLVFSIDDDGAQRVQRDASVDIDRAAAVRRWLTILSDYRHSDWAQLLPEGF